MAHPLQHAQSSARKFGGKTEDYIAIHNWLDESKAFLPDFRHRALRHHAEGIFLCERIFGVAIEARFEVLPITIALTIGVALAGAFPLRLLGRVSPAEILRGE